MDRSRLAETDRERSRARPAATLGVIDMGSNTARFVAFETTRAGTVRAFFEAKDVPRLGSGTGDDGRLADDAIDRGVQTVRRFARIVRDLGLPRTLAVATSAVRDAPNGPDYVRRVERQTGVLLRVLSGGEEAHYGYLGVAGAWALENDLVFDLGGGSMQMIDVRAGRERNSVSLPLGVLRLTQRFLEHDPPKHRELEALRDHVRETLASVLEAFGRTAYRLHGIGGTVRSLARAAIEMRQYPIGRVHGYPLYASEIEALAELLGEMSAEKRRAIPGIGGDRADVVLAGIVVLEELLRATSAERIVVSGTGIREGIALEAIGAKLPASSAELAERSTAAAAESFSFRADHGLEVAETALALFDLLAGRFEWGPSERLALGVAARMHDAGTAIDLWQHAVHSAYLIRNYPIWGLDQREVLLASMIAYLHEGDDLPSDWKRGYQPIIGAAELDAARRLGVLLELAELTAAANPRFTLGGGGRGLTVAFSALADTALSPRWPEKIRKPMERALDLELKVREP
ncbi:MAG TPA: Ppx/GppA phosphatase family protein [Thermoplasmata archaeon]|nr:Ppx/GppA phosphatase family protein [Thermoplasmata archaeon]